MLRQYPLYILIFTVFTGCPTAISQSEYSNPADSNIVLNLSVGHSFDGLVVIKNPIVEKPILDELKAIQIRYTK